MRKISKLTWLYSLLAGTLLVLTVSCEKNENHSEIPVVITTEITDITTTSALGGGEILSDGGASITARGVCWSTHENPTISDSTTVDSLGVGTFTSLLENLIPETTYYVRAYATNSVGTGYGHIVSFTTAEEQKPPKFNEYRGYNDVFIGDFRCGLFVPPDYNDAHRHAVIIYLHGYGNLTNPQLPWYRDPFLTDDPAIVITPKCPTTEEEGWGHSWENRLSPSLSNAFAVIDSIEKYFTVDPTRYYIYGTSLGGYGTYSALSYFPNRFAAAYIQCAAGNPEIAPLLVDTPIWIFHGSEDDAVPVEGGRSMYQAIVEAGGKKVRYTEYEGVGHNTWDYVRNETTLFTWFRSQQRGVERSEPTFKLNPVKTFTDEGNVVITWQLPEANEPNPDNRVWYVRLYKNGEPFQEIYNNRSTFTDATAQDSDIYQLAAVNYFFLAGELEDAVPTP